MNNLKAEQKLLTNAWIDDVGVLMTAIRAFPARRTLQNGCHVVLFELTGDRELHVNVTHARHTTSPAGWSGPGVTPDGFVHNRRFDCTEAAKIARHIHEMVYAPRRPETVRARNRLQ
jgi:hypothetical protein